MKILSLDFGGSSVKYGLIDENAVIAETGKLPAPLASVEQFQDTVASLAETYRGTVQGIGISLPGNIDPESGILLENGVYRQLYGQNIVRLTEEACSLPAAVENDGKCGALSEAWNGGLRDCRDGAVLILGSAIAGGMIKDHKIHSGRWFNAGEFSYHVIRPGDYSRWTAAYMSAGMLGVAYKLCKMKNLDLSVQDSAPTLERLDQFLGKQFDLPDQPPKKIRADGRQFSKWLEEGDPDAEKVYRELIITLGALVFNIQICYAPERIVIGGGFSSNERVLPDIQKEAAKYCEGMGLGDKMCPEIVRSRFLGEANLLGAAYNYLNRAG